MMRFIACIAALLISMDGVANCVVKLRVFDSPPNYYQDEKRLWQGYAVAMSSAIIRQAGCKVEYIDAPFKRSLQFLSIGKIDMMSNLSKTTEREKYINFFATQRTEKVGIVIPLKGNVDIESLDDLSELSKPVGYLHGVFYGEKFKNKLKNDARFSLNLVSFYETKKMMEALKRNRIAGFFYDKVNAKRMLKLEEHSDEAKIHEYTIYQNTIYFGLSRKSVSYELAEKLKAAYLALKKAGALNDIMKTTRRFP